MSTSVEQSFVKHFQAEVHMQYQNMGSKLRNTVRSKDGIIGSSTTFQKVGKGTASTKARHGKVPVMNVDHTPIEVSLYDYYAGDWVDQLDELKGNSKLDKSTNYAGTGVDGLTKAKVLSAFEMLGEADVPDDGERYAIIGWKQWSDLLSIPEFANADYIGKDELPWQGSQAKRWLGALWMPHSGLTKDGSNVRYCYWYHKTAIGHAIGADVKTDVSWHGDRAAHFVNNSMSQGAGMIDTSGVVSLRCKEV